MIENYCIICGRKLNYSSKYCKKHAHQIRKYGKPIDNNPRTKFDPNEFRFIGDNVVEFDTYDVNGNVLETYKIDAEDYSEVSKYKWRTVKGYASHGAKANYLHRLITHAKLGQQIDHINLDITDNRKCNLRVATNSLNQANKKGYNKFGYKGIEYHKKINKWSAYFRMENKQYHSPCYATQEEAAFARFILEQMFCKYELTQFTADLINSLTTEQKEDIINGLKKKFHK